jgi:hypothetical protein
VTTTLWIAEKKSLTEAVAKALPGSAEFEWEKKELAHNRVGSQWFVWLDGHAFEQAMPDHYLPDTAPKPVYKCPTCKQGELRPIPGPKGKFWGRGRYKEGCKATYPDKAGCPDLAVKPR